MLLKMKLAGKRADSTFCHLSNLKRFLKESEWGTLLWWEWNFSYLSFYFFLSRKRSNSGAGYITSGVSTIDQATNSLKQITKVLLTFFGKSQILVQLIRNSLPNSSNASSTLNHHFQILLIFLASHHWSVTFCFLIYESFPLGKTNVSVSLMKLIYRMELLETPGHTIMQKGKMLRKKRQC